MSHQNKVTTTGNNIFSYIEAKLNNIGNQIYFVRKQIKWLKSHFTRVISFLNFYERQYHVIIVIGFSSGNYAQSTRN
jgi:hypothetical protein